MTPINQWTSPILERRAPESPLTIKLMEEDEAYEVLGSDGSLNTVLCVGVMLVDFLYDEN